MERLTKKYETLFRKNVHIKHVITLFQKKLVLNLLCIITRPPKKMSVSVMLLKTHPGLSYRSGGFFFQKGGLVML